MTDEFEDAKAQQLANWRAGFEKEGESQVRLTVASGALNTQPEYRRVAMEWLREKDSDQRVVNARHAKWVRVGSWITGIAAVVAAITGVLSLFH